MPAKSSGRGDPSSKRAKEGASSGSLPALEKRVWTMALESPDKAIKGDELHLKLPDAKVEELMAAINSLLRKSLLAAQRLGPEMGGTIQYVASSKTEASMMGSMEGDESIIYAHIKDSGNEGIWTKQLKVRTNLHQTVMTRCLKSLEQKQLIKAVKSVKYPTRKIYMLYNMTPSVEISGGPWYTDNELDTVFIENLCNFLHKYITKKTWPPQQSSSKHGSFGNFALLYPVSHTPELPTAQSCHHWLRSHQLTQESLSVEDVKSLLDVLIYDGKIEKIPSLPTSSISLRNNSSKKKDKRKRRDESEDSNESASESDSTSASASTSETNSRSETGSESDSESESGMSSDVSDRVHSKGKRKRATSNRRRSTKRRKSSSSSSKNRSRSRHRDRERDRDRDGSKRDRSSSSKKSRSSSSKNKSSKYESRSSKSVAITSDDEGLGSAAEEDGDDYVPSGGTSSAFVYRAIRPYYVQMGWTEIPCGHCPVFDFCEQGGPVNAERCIYLGDWMVRSGTNDRGMKSEEENQGLEQMVNGKAGHQGEKDKEKFSSTDDEGEEGVVDDNLMTQNGFDDYDYDYESEEA